MRLNFISLFSALHCCHWYACSSSDSISFWWITSCFACSINISLRPNENGTCNFKEVKKYAPTHYYSFLCPFLCVWSAVACDLRQSKRYITQANRLKSLSDQFPNVVCLEKLVQADVPICLQSGRDSPFVQDHMDMVILELAVVLIHIKSPINFEPSMINYDDGIRYWPFVWVKCPSSMALTCTFLNLFG